MQVGNYRLYYTTVFYLVYHSCNIPRKMHEELNEKQLEICVKKFMISEEDESTAALILMLG